MFPFADGPFWEALGVSTGLVALAEIGDKTMLLAVLLAAAWRRPVPILAGILVATVANHAVAAIAGALNLVVVGSLYFKSRGPGQVVVAA